MRMKRVPMPRVNPVDADRGWCVISNEDLTEGRGGPVIVAVCRLEATARRLALRRGVQGTNATVQAVPIWRVDGIQYGPIYLVPATEQDTATQTALDAQRQALGRARALGMTEPEIMALMTTLDKRQ